MRGWWSGIEMILKKGLYLHTGAYLHTGSYNSEVHLSCVSFLNSFYSCYCKISVFLSLVWLCSSDGGDSSWQQGKGISPMSLSHSYIVVVIGFSVTLSFGFIFYYHSYIFSLTFILFCFSSFFFFLTCSPHCSVFAPLSSCGPVYLGSCLVLVFVCQCTWLLFISTSTSYFGGSRSFVSPLWLFCMLSTVWNYFHSFCLSFPISPHCHKHCVRSLVCSPEGGPCYSSLAFVFVFVNVGVFYWFLKARLLLEQFSLHATFGCSPPHSTHLLWPAFGLWCQICHKQNINTGF